MFNKSQLESIGLTVGKEVYYNCSVAELEEMSIQRKEGRLASNGAIVVRTGERTGRSPNDRFIVEEPTTKDKIWWGDVNRPATQEQFDHLFNRIKDHLKDKDLFVFDAYSGADRRYRLPVRVVSPKAWHALFAQTLFVRPSKEDLESSETGFTVINASDDLQLDPEKDLFGSPVAILVNFEKRIILVAGSGYGGEMKKSIFSVMNFNLPQNDVFPMHCSANVGKDGDSALFFGLSGTGKTTLSADTSRRLIGDDQHGWSKDGIFNFEGGCYAKCINLSHEAEPQIYDAIRFGSILENVIIDDKTRVIDYDDKTITENTRATYPVEYIPNCLTDGVGDHPKNIFLLTCDAFGVLPPISKLSPEQAMYHFISGYTAKVAGTEVGIKEPVATFSACFGSPFLPLHPGRYADQLGEKLKGTSANCWLVNTGWSGGAYGTGERMKIQITRALLDAAFSGALTNAEYHVDPTFNLRIPNACPGIPTEVLNPINTWRDQAAYKETALKLAGMFIDNFKQFEEGVSEEIIKAGPTR